MNRVSLAACLLATAFTVGGCHSFTEAKKQTPPPRPVLSVAAEPEVNAQSAYTGTIQARYQTDRGFQVVGRVIAFDVAVGDLVRPGTILAQIDPLALDLAIRGSESDLVKAQADLANATAMESRISELFSRQVSTKAELDTAHAAREVAAATVQRVAAALAKAQDNRGYASLTADADGVVISTFTQVGQTVLPGQKVMTVARLDARDAVIDLPEPVVQTLDIGAEFAVFLQADPTVTTTGKIREIAPEADAATRTRRVRIALDHLSDGFRLGATISAKSSNAPTDGPLTVPSSAVIERDGKPRVWVVDTSAKTVHTVPIAISATKDATAFISDGLTAGTRVVVAGVHSLTEGQSIRVDEGASQ